MGRRIEKKVYFNDILIRHVRFVYDGYLQIEELDALNNNAELKQRIWSGGKIICEIHGSVRYYALGDANKNITEYIDSSGNISAHYEYSPFGKITVSTGTMPSDFDFRFSSEYYDPETKLVYYNYRYYSPELGRWLSRDPIGEYDEYNIYAIVDNDIVDWIDYLGARKKPAWYEPHGALDNFISGILGTDYVAAGIINTAAESDHSIISRNIEKNKEFLNDIIKQLKALYTLLRIYQQMRDANVIGADKYFHCIGFCKVSRIHSKDFAKSLALLREVADNIKNFYYQKNHPLEQLIDSLEDMFANATGYNCPSSKSCKECCCKYKVRGL